MPRFDAVIHHGGAGIAYSAIRAGKPSLVWPRDYDQFDYAARIVARGVGLSVRRLDSRQAVPALTRVLGGLDPLAGAALAAAATPYDPYAAVERTVLRCLGSEPPSRDHRGFRESPESARRRQGTSASPGGA